MTYRDTARAYVKAEQSQIFGRPDSPHALAAAALPVDDWTASRRDVMSPQTIAHNHAFYVSDAAHDLRAMLAAPAPEPTDLNLTPAQIERYRWIEHNARRLLAAIGEAEDS